MVNIRSCSGLKVRKHAACYTGRLRFYCINISLNSIPRTNDFLKKQNLTSLGDYLYSTLQLKTNLRKCFRHGTRADARPRRSSKPESHCTSVRVSADDKWRSSQSKPICTSIRRGAKWGSTCIFLPAEKPYISAKTLPRGDGIRGRQGGEGGAGPIQLKY